MAVVVRCVGLIALDGLPSDHGRMVAANSNYDENGVFLT